MGSRYCGTRCVLGRARRPGVGRPAPRPRPQHCTMPWPHYPPQSGLPDGRSISAVQPCTVQIRIVQWPWFEQLLVFIFILFSLFQINIFLFQIVWKWIEQFKLCLLDQWPVDHIHSTAQWCTVQYCTVQWTSPPIGLQSVPRWPAPGHHAALSSRLCTPVQHKYYGHVTDMLGRTCKLWCYGLVSKINCRNHLLSPASGHSGNCR